MEERSDLGESTMVVFVFVCVRAAADETRKREKAFWFAPYFFPERKGGFYFYP